MPPHIIFYIMSVHSDNMPGWSRNSDPYATGNRDRNSNPRTDTPQPGPYLGQNSAELVQHASIHNQNPNLSPYQSLMFLNELDWNKIDSKDWNKQVLAAVLQQQMQDIINKYNEGLRDEQRQYDLPINQLNRLTSAGISRDAAIQMMSGSAGGGSSSVPYADAGQLPQVPTASESMRNTVQTAGTIISSAIGLCNAGFSAAQSVSQMKLMNASRYSIEKQNKAYQLTGEAYQLLSNEVRRGAISDDDGHLYDSVGSLCDGLEKLAKMGNLTAQEMHGNGTIDALRSLSPFASPILQGLYKSERGGRDYETSFTALMANEFADAEVKQMQVQSLAKGVELYDAQIKQLLADENFIRETTAMLAYQKRLIEAQTDNYKADTRWKKLNSRMQDLQNRMQAAVTEGSISVPLGPGNAILTGSQLFGLQTLNTMKASCLTSLELNNRKYWEKQVEKDMSDADVLISTNILNHLIQKNGIDSFNAATDEQKAIMGLGASFKQSGVFDYMNTWANARKKSVSVLGSGVTEVQLPFSVEHTFYSNPTQRGLDKPVNKPKK